MNEAIKENL